MSKATIIITDSGANGITVSLGFDPPVKTDVAAPLTPSQHAALVMLDALKSSDTVDETSEPEFE